MFDSPLVWLLILIGLAGVFSLGVFLGAYVAEKDARKRVNKVLDGYFPISPEPTLNGLKWRIREELGIEQPGTAKRPYW